MGAVDQVKSKIRSLNLSDSEDWTPAMVINDADKAAEVIKLAITDKDFVEFEFKNGTKVRTNISTAKKMLTLRSTLESFTRTENDISYSVFWKEMKELNDAYFLQFFIDLYETDDNLMSTVNRIRKEKKEAAIERGKKAYAARKAKAAEAEKAEETADKAE